MLKLNCQDIAIHKNMEKNYNQWFSEGNVVITVQDGRTELLAIDESRVGLIDERFFTSLPNGKYTLKNDHDGNPSIVPFDPYNSKIPSLKMPNLEYTNDVAVLGISNRQIKDFVTSLNEAAKKSEVIRFESVKGGNGLDVTAKFRDEDNNDTYQTIYHTDQKVPEYLRCTVGSDYLTSAISTMLGRQRERKFNGINDFMLKIKSDYPVEISFSTEDAKGDQIGYRSLIAPRIE